MSLAKSLGLSSKSVRSPLSSLNSRSRNSLSSLGRNRSSSPRRSLSRQPESKNYNVTIEDLLDIDEMVKRIEQKKQPDLTDQQWAQKYEQISGYPQDKYLLWAKRLKMAPKEFFIKMYTKIGGATYGSETYVPVIILLALSRAKKNRDLYNYFLIYLQNLLNLVEDSSDRFQLHKGVIRGSYKISESLMNGEILNLLRENARNENSKPTDQPTLIEQEGLAFNEGSFDSSLEEIKWFSRNNPDLLFGDYNKRAKIDDNEFTQYRIYNFMFSSVLENPNLEKDKEELISDLLGQDSASIKEATKKLLETGKIEAYILGRNFQQKALQIVSDFDYNPKK